MHPEAGRAVRWIVPCPPGGGADPIARTIAPRLGELLGTAVIVENRAGGAAVIGTEAAARAPADGTTLLLGNNQTHGLNSARMARVPYDPARDFAPLALIAIVPHVLVVPAASPARRVADLIAAARANPGRVSYGSSSPGSAAHIMGALLARSSDTTMTHVGYRGTGPAVTDLIGGRLDFIVATLASVAGAIAAGQLRPLAVNTPARLPAMAEVPTFDELGLAAINVETWYAAFAPAGLPAPVLARLSSAFGEALATPEVRDRPEGLGNLVRPLPAPETADHVRRDVERMADLVRRTGVTLE